jgi:hypothetical protein
MDDLYCPACRLVLYRRALGQADPRHCPRCVARSRRLVTLLTLDVLPQRDDASEVGPGGSSSDGSGFTAKRER